GVAVGGARRAPGPPTQPPPGAAGRGARRTCPRAGVGGRPPASGVAGAVEGLPNHAGVAGRLRALAQGHVVLDPVMIAKSGDSLLEPDARAALVKEMLPLATVVTPNLHEAGALAGMAVATESDIEEA